MSSRGEDLEHFFNQFAFLVSPVAYDFKAFVDPIPGYRFKRAFGVPDNDKEAPQGEPENFLEITTLFLVSPKKSGGSAIFLEYEPE